MTKKEHNTPRPKHVAIIMDGNGRWAELRNAPRHKGHREGVKAVKRVVKACIRKNISTLTLFAFSSENWNRPRKEVSLLMELFLTALSSEIRDLDKNGVKIRFIGNRAHIPANVQRAMEDAETQTSANQRLTLVIAVSYGGHWDIVQATQQIANQVIAGELKVEDINESHIDEHISTVGIEPPDLFIRTGGEQRISNFLLWQMAYTELFFTEVLWPEFDEEMFDLALEDYANRQRRYGMTSEQLSTSRASNA